MNRLLVFTENFVWGGANLYLTDVVNSVVHLFKNITVVSNKGGIFPQDIKRARPGVCFYPISLWTRNRIHESLKRLPRLMRAFPSAVVRGLAPLLFVYNIIVCVYLIRRFRPSLVLSCNGGYPGARSTLAMVVASRLLRIPVVLTIVSVPLSRRFKMLDFERFLDSLIWSSVRVVVVNAHAIANALENHRGLPHDKVHVIHNGLEDNFPMSEKCDGLEREFVVGYIARMEQAKGCLHLLDAFTNLASDDDKMRLVLVGEGDASKFIAQRVKVLGLKNRVEIVGDCSGDTTKFLESFDVYVLPSLHEGLPYSLLEAMRAGCAIVATTVGGIPEAINNEIEGLLVAAGSIEELQQAIKRLRVDPDLRLRLGNKARRRFLCDFKLQLMHQNVQSLWASIDWAKS